MIGAERDHVAMAMVVSGMVVLAIHLEITDHRLQVTRMHRQPPLLPPGILQLQCPEGTEQARRRRVSLSSLPVLEHIQTDGQQARRRDSMHPFRRLRLNQILVKLACIAAGDCSASRA